MSTNNMLSLLEHKLAVSEDIRNQLAAMDHKGVLLKIIKETLMPQIRKDIIMLFGMEYPTNIKDFFIKHRNIVNFLSKYDHQNSESFRISDIESYEKLYERTLFERKMLVAGQDVEYQKQRDLIKEKERGLHNLKAEISELHKGDTYRFTLNESGSIELGLSGTHPENPEAYQLPNYYIDIMNTMLQGKSWFNTSLEDMGPLLLFVKLKEQHFEELIDVNPKRITQYETQLKSLKYQFDKIGGHIPKGEIEKLDLFFRGSDPGNYNPATYLNCFDTWQRKEFISQIKKC